MLLERIAIEFSSVFYVFSIDLTFISVANAWFSFYDPSTPQCFKNHVFATEMKVKYGN